MKVSSAFNKLIFWPLTRAYVKYILGDRPADTILRYLCIPQFWMVHRYWPDFLYPERFSEKLWNRLLYERDPILTLISDKYRVREYVAKKVGSKYLVPLLWNGDVPEDIPFDQLPLKFVIKTNHGCGYNIIVKDKTRIDQVKTRETLTRWLGENFGQDYYNGIGWAYKNIKPTIIIEAFIGENDKPPVDYKFYCFSGRVEILTVHIDRHERHKTIAFNRNFERFKFRPEFKQYDGDFQRPPMFDEMVWLAESLSEEFDFIRVDLYNPGNKIYFGELTVYPAGISSFLGFDIRALDSILGDKWKRK
jgi:hypothetical protein